MSGHNHDVPGDAQITNASDVVLKIGGHKAGNGAKLVVEEFEFQSTNKVESKHGCGNHNPVGVTFGNAEYEFRFTLAGEDRPLFNELKLKDDGTPRDIQITGSGPETHWRIPHAWSDERTFSGTDDDATEYDGRLVCWPPQIS